MAIHYQEPLDRTFHALGDGTRRRMLSMLATQGALTANELRAPFDVAQPTISKHLKVLEHAGLIIREVDGRLHRFHLQPATMNEAADWITRHEAFWQNTLASLEAFIKNFDNLDNET